MSSLMHCPDGFVDLDWLNASIIHISNLFENEFSGASSEKDRKRSWPHVLPNKQEL